MKTEKSECYIKGYNDGIQPNQSMKTKEYSKLCSISNYKDYKKGYKKGNNLKENK